MKTLVTTVTERGQVSIPADVRKTLHLEPGMKLVWQLISDHECREGTQKAADRPGAMAMRAMRSDFARLGLLPSG